MRKARVIIVTVLVTAVATAFIMMGGFWLWFSRVCTPEMILIQKATQFRAVVTDKPGARARLYTLGDDRYLLVLTAKFARRPEGYYIDLFRGEVGLPDFPEYVPLGRYALVDGRIYQGFPDIGALKVRRDPKGNEREIHMRFEGFKVPEPGMADDQFMRRDMPIGQSGGVRA